MNVVRFNPFRELMDLERQMSSVLEQTRRRRGETEEDGSLALWAPAVDVSETDDAIVFRAELPGLGDQDVDVQVSENVLTLRGERRFQGDEKTERYHRVERAYGTFSRSFSLPATIERDQIAAEFSRGVLTVTVPKREETKPRQIKIAIGSSKEK